MAALLERIKNEPVMVVAVAVAIGNLFGVDVTPFAAGIETAVVLVVGVVLRHFVTPTNKLG